MKLTAKQKTDYHYVCSYEEEFGLQLLSILVQRVKGKVEVESICSGYLFLGQLQLTQ